MRYRSTFFLALATALLLLASGCSRADVAGVWSGSMSGVNADKNGAADIQVTFHQTFRGLSGRVTCRNTKGPWEVLEGNTLTVTSGAVSGNRVNFVAGASFPGGTITADFKGNVEGTSMKGQADVNVGSVMGGDTYLGKFEVTRK